MKITRTYIIEHRTENGAWTRPQIEALGVDWPPRGGWIDRVVGDFISKSNQKLFESKVGIKHHRKMARPRYYGNPEESFEDRKATALQKHKTREKHNE